MKIAVVGYSNFVQKRLLPALSSVYPAASIHIFSRRSLSSGSESSTSFFPYASLDNHLSRYSYRFVYVSGENSIHYQVALKVLSTSNHLVVDKPVALEHAAVESLCNIAQERGLCLFEASIWTFHRQFLLLDEFLRRHKDFHASSFFTIPMLKEHDFRINSQPGSGAFWDMGVYAVGLLQYLGLTNNIQVTVKGALGGNSPQRFSLLSSDSTRVCRVTCGFGYRYRNSLTLVNEKERLSFDRTYSFPLDGSVTVNSISGLSKRTIVVSDDAMSNFLRHVETSLSQASANSGDTESIRTRHSLMHQLSDCIK